MAEHLEAAFVDAVGVAAVGVVVDEDVPEQASVSASGTTARRRRSGLVTGRSIRLGSALIGPCRPGGRYILRSG